MEEYRSVAETAKKWGLSARRVSALCAEGRIVGAARFARVWAIPKDAQKPMDARIKSGKYIGFSEKYRKKNVPTSNSASEPVAQSEDLSSSALRRPRKADVSR